MATEINGVTSNLTHIAGDTGQVSRNNGGAAPSGGTAPELKSDQFSLTESAARLQQLEKEISNQPVVDSQKVADMQRALVADSVRIDPARVAEKLLTAEHAVH